VVLARRNVVTFIREGVNDRRHDATEGKDRPWEEPPQGALGQGPAGSGLRCVGRPDEDPSVFRVLTTREREVLQLMAEGNTTKQIALKLHISPKTVEAHRRNIVEKVGIDNVAQLTKYAIQEGLTESDI